MPKHTPISEAGAIEDASNLLGDTETALRFIKAFRPEGGTIVLVAITPNDPVTSATFPNGPIVARSFNVADTAALRAWIDERQGRANLYFTVNTTHGPMDKKPTKADMAQAVAVFLDLDPDPEKPFATERQRLHLLAVSLFASPAPPSFIIDSGGGYQVFWRLDAPLPLAGDGSPGVARAEGIGRALRLHFGGDAVENVDRIMRLPGTVNIPTRTKLAKGRKPALAKLLDASMSRYAPRELGELCLWQLDGLADIAEPLRSKLSAALLGDKLLFPRWCGDTTELKDKTCSGFAMSIGAILKGLGFERTEMDEILRACPQSKSEKLNDRALDRIWNRSKAAEGSRKKALAGGMLEMVLTEAKLWHSDAGEGFATIKRAGHTEHLQILSEDFKFGWLVLEHLERGGAPPNNEDLSIVMNAVKAYALKGDPRAYFLRVARHEEAIYIDLVNSDFTAVKVTAEGWDIVENAEVPIAFVRRPGMLPLPMPERGGNIEMLRPFLNLSGDDDFMLYVGCLLADLHCPGPYPIVAISGEREAGKTALTNAFVGLIDPSTSGARAMPDTELNFQVMARHGHLLPYENVTGISTDQGNCLCRMSTGAGFGTRELYTTVDQRSLYACRPQIMNSIQDLAIRGDVASRTVVLTAPYLAPEKRIAEDEFLASFKGAAPEILGALLDGLSHALATMDTEETKRRVGELPRLGVFAKVAAAGVGAFGWSPEAFMKAYRENQQGANISTLEGDGTLQALKQLGIDKTGFTKLADDKNGKPDIGWRGTVTELHKTLQAAATFKSHEDINAPLPPNSNRLGRHLRSIGPDLRAAGIDVQFPRGHNAAKIMTIRWSETGTIDELL